MSPSVPRMSETMYHDWLLPDEARKIRSEVRRFVDEEVMPVADELNTASESVEAFPVSLFHRMAELDLFGVPFSAENGGRGLRYPLCATAVVMEELAYASSGLAAMYDDHCLLPGIALRAGSDFIRSTYLRPVIDGTLVGCMAITEPEAGSDLRVETLQTRGRLGGDSYILRGRKRYITNAPVGSFATTLCALDDQLCMLVVDLDTPGITVGDIDIKTGNRAQLTADVVFDNAAVPARNLVGAPGHGLKIALSALTWGRIVIGMSGVAMAQAAFDQCVSFMKDREMYEGRLSDLQHWQFRLAEHASQISMARDLCYKAARRYDEGAVPPEPETAMAKYYGTRVGGDMARDAVQIHGGAGFITRLGADGSACRVEQIYRDCKVAEIYEGANEVQKRGIARQIFGRDYVR